MRLFKCFDCEFCRMTHAELRQTFYRRLSALYPQGELLALYHWCINEIHGWNRAEAYLHNDDQVGNEYIETWERAILRLEGGMPVQYVFGRTSFCGLEIKVDTRVLIPRPETEELVDLLLKRHGEASLNVIDVGCGSGCIGLALKKKRPSWEIIGMDISEDALELAKENAQINGLEVTFSSVDILEEPLPDKVDVVVSNPPYIPADKPSLVDENVMKFEPHLALFAPEQDPFRFFIEITEKAKLNGAREVLFETHATHIQELIDALGEHWSGEIEVHLDSSGKERFLVLS